jgi:hypothetical protein
MRRAILILGFLPLAVSATVPGRPRHDLYVCATLEDAFFIGSRKDGRSGLWRSADRIMLEHVGPDHPRIDAVAASPRDPTELYLAAANGLIRVRGGVREWRIMTGWDMTELKDVAIDPHDPAVIYVALPDGIGVSRDGGRSWERGQQGIAQPYTQTLALDRFHAGRLVAGTERGVYLSEDGARSWRLVLPTRATVNDVRQSPHHPQRFLAVTQADGLWLSEDRARTWRQLTAAGQVHTLHRGTFDAGDPRRLAVCGWGCGVLVSEDDGATWTPRNAGLPSANVWCMAADPDQPGRLYASPHGGAVHVSDDFGRTWRKLWFERVTVRSFAFPACDASVGRLP